MTTSKFVPLQELDPEAARLLPDDVELLVSNMTIDQIVAEQYGNVYPLNGISAHPVPTPADMEKAADFAVEQIEQVLSAGD